MMNFLSIPEEVIEGNLLPFLKWNDLLRFRRVCKVTKEITQGYMKVHPELAPEIEIVEDDAKRSLEAYLKMNIPTNRIFLNNPSGDEFYKKEGKIIPKFLKKYGPVVKHLRVKQFSLYVYGKEWDFMEALVNLQSFEAEYFGVGKKFSSPEELGEVVQEKIAQAKQDPRFVDNIVPNIFKQLKSLRIGQQKGVIIGNITNRTGGFLDKAQGLEHVSLPFNSHFATTSAFVLPEGRQPFHAMMTAFLFIDSCIQQRAKDHPDKPNLKTVDFSCYHDEEGMEAAQMQVAGSIVFLELLGNCMKYGVQLKNVGPLWFHHRSNLPQYSSRDLGTPVLSLVNLHPCVLLMNMPNLQRVEIRGTSRSSPGPQWRQFRTDWPALKSVDITVDSKIIPYSEWENGLPNEDVMIMDSKSNFQFLFQDVRRINMTEIRLNFTKEAGQVAIPKTDDIVASCPNLKKITIINWPGTNKALIKLWDGLPALEEISLEYCKGLGNVAFVGEDAKNPVFFKLKKLSKLSLKGLDQMPKITDTLFSLVLRHLKLTHLILASDRPLKSVTSAGIASLLKGNFAGKIERFPFQHWSLEGLSTAEFKKIEAKFRSYNML